MSTIFEIITLKWAYLTIFLKIWKKSILNDLTNQAKTKDEDGKSKNEYDFWTLHHKIRHITNFHKNLREKKIKVEKRSRGKV